MKNAWMILAHNQFPLLEKLIAFLDSENSAFFLHIDAKAVDADAARLAAAAKKSPVTFVDRVSISWGDFSMVEAELRLLRAALDAGCDRFHLLSGVDVPIKSRQYIEDFFASHPETNYVNFQNPEIDIKNLWRVRFYYPFQRFNIRKNGLRRLLRNGSAGVQLLLGVDRTRKYDPSIVFQKGTQWFSITRPLAEYVLSREAEIRQIFRSTYCPDELVIQTMVASSAFLETLPSTAFDAKHLNCCRYIDWKRGNPYVFRDGDYDELVNADPSCLFARKFDYEKFQGIVDRLYEKYGE